jgi:hypothetical protein
MALVQVVTSEGGHCFLDAKLEEGRVKTGRAGRWRALPLCRVSSWHRRASDCFKLSMNRFPSDHQAAEAKEASRANRALQENGCQTLGTWLEAESSRPGPWLHHLPQGSNSIQERHKWHRSPHSRPMQTAHLRAGRAQKIKSLTWSKQSCNRKE